MIKIKDNTCLYIPCMQDLISTLFLQLFYCIQYFYHFFIVTGFVVVLFDVYISALKCSIWVIFRLIVKLILGVFFVITVQH